MRAARRFRQLTNLSDLILLGMIVMLLIRLLPKEILSEFPATGGDTGSHFWPLLTLLEHGLPNFAVRVWNPGNLGGEPHLVHYFPLPYFIMAVLSIFVKPGTAFNIGTYLPVLTLPLAAYVSIRGMGLRWPAPILCALGTLFCTLNEGFNMWGGNLLSTLAGQFAHMYALNFILLGAGALGSELRHRKPPLLSAICFSCVATSHSYVMLGLPFFGLSLLIWHFRRGVKAALLHYVVAGVLAGLLSLWFLVPMITNAAWTTPFSMIWISKNILREAAPKMLDPLLYACGIGLLGTLMLRRWSMLRVALFWAIPGALYIVYYFLFPSLGLVDIRALPQVVLFVSLGGMILFADVLRWSSPRIAFVLLPVLFGTSIWSIRDDLRSAEPWLKWNYGGWQSKKLYPELAGVTGRLKGNFSQGRVAYEHSDLSRGAGTERVFEMLPYFASRSTLESLYMQSTILALPVYYFQSEISRTPSCPFPELKCSQPDLVKAHSHMNLLGVSDLILISDDVLGQARSADWLEERESFKPWIIFKNKDNPRLVDTLASAPELIDEPSYKIRFYEWFREFDGSQPFLLNTRFLSEDAKADLPAKLAASVGGSCHPAVAVDFRGLSLKTDCPGKLHMLKFAYHGTWRADTGDQLYLLSPGYIGIIPSKSEVRLNFGQSPLWRWSGRISLLSLLIAGWYSFRRSLALKRSRKI